MSTTGWSLPDDPLGAFCRHNHAALKGSGKGPLAGLAFAAKDLFHIEGRRTGFGHPGWLASHPPATRTAPAVQALLDAGWTTTDIVTLSQIAAFLSFQIRVVAGLRTLAGRS